MNTPLRIAALAAALSCAGAASAQQAPPPSRTRIGLGVGLPTSELSSFNTFTGGVNSGLVPAQLYLPIDVGPGLRIEPQLGLFTSRQDGGDSMSWYSLGAGAFARFPLASAAQLYAGGRLALVWQRGEQVGGGGAATRVKGTDLWLAAAVGGEVFPHPRLGVGAEAQLGHTWIGDRDYTTGAVTVTQSGGGSWQTQGVLFVRFYFT